MKNDINAHVARYLDYFINLDSPPEFAVLLKGNWGCGKTWFIKQYIERKRKKGVDFIYISLYGISSTNEINESIFEQIHPILGSKGMKIAGSIFKSVFKTTINLDLNNDKKTDGSISPSFSGLELHEYFQKIDNRILVFDDLERCSVELKDLLGYINQFSENKLLKVIILANENEILLKEKKNNIETYLKIKEKLIGQSLTIRADIFDALKSFLAKVKSQKLKRFLLTNQKTILDQYAYGGFGNLRHVKQGILDFDRFYSCIPPNAFDKPPLIKSLLESFFAITFEMKYGSISEDEIRYIFAFPFGSKENKKDKFQIIREKYPVFNFNLSNVDPRIWSEYFNPNGFNADSITNLILSSPYFKNELSADWIKYWRFIELDNDEFKNLTQRLYEDYTKNKLKEAPVVIHLAGMFFSYSESGLIAFNKEDILMMGKKNLDRLKKTLITFKPGYFPGDTWFGMQYHGLGVKEFRTLLEYASTLVTEVFKEQLPANAERVLNSLKTSLSDFEELITPTRSGQNEYYDIPVLNFIPAKEFASTILKMHNVDLKYIGDILIKRYSNIDTREALKDELEWIQTITSILVNYQVSNEGTISYLIISQLLTKLERITVSLQNLK
jgi:hypothetical protein